MEAPILRRGGCPANLRQMPSKQNDKGNLNIETTHVSDHVVLIVSGRMDAENATQFEEKCQGCIAEGHTSLVADLGGLAYISSMGLRSFLSVAKTLQSNGGALRLCCLKGLVKQVFEITGLLQVFSVYESVESAVL
jgi:anti-anti-sigma factor